MQILNFVQQITLVTNLKKLKDIFAISVTSFKLWKNYE